MGENTDEIRCSIELQEELQAFKVADQRRMWELRNAINDLEAKVNILHTRSRANTWEVVSDRVTSEIDRISATLNERMTEVERAVQTQSTSPATSVEQNQAIHEDIQKLDSRIEAGFRAFSRKVDEPREWTTQSVEGILRMEQQQDH